MLAFYSLKSGIFKLTGFTRTGLKLFILNCIILLVATKTRNAWIACWLFFAAYGLLKEKKYLWLSLLLPPLALLSPPILERARDLLQGTGTNIESELNSFAWRMELWKSGLAYAKDNLVFGYGLNSFRPLSVEFFKGASAGGAPAHNTYVQMLFEAGVIGALLYISIFWSILKAFFKRIKKSASRLSLECAIATAYVISYAFSCAGDNLPDYIAFNWYVWFFIGIILKAIHINYEENINHHSIV
ncbi:MAG: hypothetical protein A2901_07850 [Elusimicrobia bacterium RIFCSPLOWO2_01_FULL_54_10]|nr:MAG: hypothetical protein A2901_07850 [Elusimicrobia bacterium RIFCSPLOWO2_01_FULL_54_10]